MLSLHQAVAENSIGQVQKLIDEGANVNASGFEIFPHGKCTPLQVAAYKGYDDIAELLISNGALLEAKNQKGQTALKVAIYAENIKVVKLLLSKGAYPYLFRSVLVNNTEIVRSLLENGANVEETEENSHFKPLHLATLKGNCEIIQLLIDYNADINASINQGYTPLQDAISKNNLKATKLLLDNGANPNLTSSGISLPLHFAVSNYYFKIVRLLVSYNVDLNRKNMFGQTVLHCLRFAIQTNKVLDMFKFLICNGAR